MGDIFHRRVLSRTHGLLGDFLANAMKRGLLRQDDPLGAARQFIALCQSGSYQQIMLRQRDEATTDAIALDVGLALDTFLRAYSSGG